MKYFAIFLVLAGFSGIVLAQQVFAEDSLSFDFAHDLSEDDFDTGRFIYFQYGEKFYQYAYHPFGALSGDSATRCHFTSDFVLQESLLSESGYVLYKFPNDMIWPGGYENSTFYVVRSLSSNFPEDNKFEQLTPTKTKDNIILGFELVSGLNTFVANSTTFWDSQRSQIVDCPNPFDFEKQEYEYYDFVYPLKVQQNYAKMLGLDDNNELLCKPELIQILKIDGSPACVKEQSIPKLIERGWTSNMIVAAQSRDLSSNLEDATSSYMDRITPTLDDFKNVLSEPYDIDEIFSKFGKPHDDIGSGIHIYVYELNDLTEVWVGYVDEILYMKHVDANGNELEELFVKNRENPEDCPTSFNSRCITGTVTEIFDGDNVRVGNALFRLALVSPPELDEIGGQEAKAFLEEICPVGSDALVDQDDLRPLEHLTGTGRIMAVVYCNGLNLNEEMMEHDFEYFDGTYCYTSEFADDPWAKEGCSK